MRKLLVAAVLFAVACSEEPGDPRLILVQGPPELLAALRSFTDGLDQVVLADPERSASVTAAQRAGTRIELRADLACAECYRIEGAGRSFTVHGGNPLGVQYGLAHLLEAFGYRFYHPEKVHSPAELATPDRALFGVEHAPEMTVRGLQLHTLHPIEALWAFWVPDQTALARARRILDWTVKNRGNFLQWVALDDVVAAGPAHEAWRAHTQLVLDEARRRGLRTGINIQLFGRGNLQQAYDLIDDSSSEDRYAEQVRARLAHLLDGVPFDVVTLSFGEFFGASPDAFIRATNLVRQEVARLLPSAEMNAVIHLGAGEDLKVEYMGQRMLFYFLVQFADPSIVPWVHTVMYYNLFEDAGGAYGHADFAEHRRFLLDRLAAGKRVAYQPETAYWVTFDNSVPTYMPLYVLSRWIDLDRIKAAGTPLSEHVLFSTGWEWGYWQNDYAALRMSWRLPASFRDLFTDMFAPLGEAGAALAAAASDVAEIEHRYLIERRLAAYLAGRDVTIDAGYRIGIVSQPHPVTYEELAASGADAKAAFQSGVLVDLGTLADELAAVRSRILIPNDAGLRWALEVSAGVEVTELRARFQQALYTATLAGPGADLGSARALRDRARLVVQNRQDRMHTEDGRLVESVTNPTFYQFGYLKLAHDLCYWDREIVEVERLVAGSTEEIPPCFF